MKSNTYSRTRDAAKRKARAERTNRDATWDLILAAAADGAEAGLPIAGVENINRVRDICAEELVTDTGQPLAISTVRDMMQIGRWLHEEATDAEIAVIRTMGWTTVQVPQRVSATPSAVAAAVERGVRTRTELTAEFRGAGTPEEPSTTPTPPRSRFTDDAYISAVSTIAAHHTAEGRGEYQRGAMARLAGTLLGQMLVGEVVETDWDTALNELLSEDA